MTECGCCGLLFSGTEAFDRHRVGRHEYDWTPEREDGRRCLSPDELLAMGLALDDRGRWHDPARAARARQAFGVRVRLADWPKRAERLRARPNTSDLPSESDRSTQLSDYPGNETDWAALGTAA